MKNLFKKLLLAIYLLALIPSLCFAALIGTLTDNFDDNSIDGAEWTLGENSAYIEEVNNELEISTVASTESYTEIFSSDNYNLTGSQATIKIIDVGSLASWYCFDFAIVRSDWGGSVSWRITPGTSVISTSHGASTTYVAATHRYLKIREAGGTTYWDYSANGLNWTNFDSVANPFVVTSIFPWFSVSFDSQVGTTTVKVDDFNILPSATQRRIIFIQ